MKRTELSCVKHVMACAVYKCSRVSRILEAGVAPDNGTCLIVDGALWHLLAPFLFLVAMSIFSHVIWGLGGFAHC